MFCAVLLNLEIELWITSFKFLSYVCACVALCRSTNPAITLNSKTFKLYFTSLRKWIMTWGIFNNKIFKCIVTQFSIFQKTGKLKNIKLPI